MPEVSVIIPTYNHAAYITEAIDSVLAQAYQDLEIIVIDDGSNDSTQDILAPYIKEKKIRYYFQNNKGLSAARNTGLKLATGIFVKFLDSDDFLFPLQIEKHIEQISRINDKLLLTMTNFSMLSPSGRMVDVNVPMVSKESQLAHFILSNRGAIHSYLFPKTLLEEAGGFDEELKACEDFDLKLRLLMMGAHVEKIDYIGCCYRLINTSMSNDTRHMFLQKSKLYEKLNNNFLSNKTNLSFSEKEILLNKNILLIDECFARDLNLDHVLPHTIKMLGILYNTQNKGTHRIISRCLGTKNYSWLEYLYRTSTKRNYKNEILTQEISWKPR